MKDLTQTSTTRFTKTDLANYPFLKENTEYIKTLNLKIEDMTSPEFSRILERAEERLKEAILYAIVTHKTSNPEIEISSFPVTIMLTIATENQFIKKRYALAEAKQSFQNLTLEPKERILAIAHNLDWDLTPNTSPEVHYGETIRISVQPCEHPEFFGKTFFG